MRYCGECGNEIKDKAVVCPKCGCDVSQRNIDNKMLKDCAFVFMIIRTVVVGILSIICLVYLLTFNWKTPFLIHFTMTFIPFIWHLAMTIHYKRSTNRQKENSLCFKICTLIFTSLVAGMLMLCDEKK